MPSYCLQTTSMPYKRTHYFFHIIYATWLSGDPTTTSNCRPHPSLIQETSDHPFFHIIYVTMAVYRTNDCRYCICRPHSSLTRASDYNIIIHITYLCYLSICRSPATYNRPHTCLSWKYQTQLLFSMLLTQPGCLCLQTPPLQVTADHTNVLQETLNQTINICIIYAT